jgi:hypothetical protein
MCPTFVCDSHKCWATLNLRNPGRAKSQPKSLAGMVLRAAIFTRDRVPAELANINASCNNHRYLSQGCNSTFGSSLRAYATASYRRTAMIIRHTRPSSDTTPPIIFEKPLTPPPPGQKLGLSEQQIMDEILKATRQAVALLLVPGGDTGCLKLHISVWRNDSRRTALCRTNYGIDQVEACSTTE